MKALIQELGLGSQSETPSASPRKEASSFVGTDDAEIAKLAETLKVNIRIVGCGGGGSNTINRCSEEGVLGADLCAINTDAKHLLSVRASRKILIGRRATGGLGSGDRPEIGELAARENEEELRALLRGAHFVFITAGMGGGTGTGAAPLVARIAREEGALTLGIVTMPFSGEGSVRKEIAQEGLERLRRSCDTTVVIQNDRVRDMVPRMPIQDAFKVADAVLMTAIKGITEIVTKPGLVNLDFADLLAVMKDGGVAFIGLGESEKTDDRVAEAISDALTSPLLGHLDVSEATGALIRITGGSTMTVSEAEKAAELVAARLSKRARIFWGCSVEPSEEMRHAIRVLLVITGVKSEAILAAPQLAHSRDPDAIIDFVR